MSTTVRPSPQPTDPPAPSSPGPFSAPDVARPDTFRPEIQGLRAVAVGLVVLYHLWPKRLSGGYVGVDVFFVISGFLITSHIFREVGETGQLQVLRFWARRIRRLLPASLLVLALSVVAVAVWVPSTEWGTTFRQVAASALYVQNWALAFDAVDYMAADNVPTVAQHYWSLSVEEQFYLVWPLLILGVLALQRRLWRGGRGGRRRAQVSADARRRAILTGLAVLALASLAWSAYSTTQDQPFAYMSTLTRVWEFAAGAITALVAVRLGSGLRSALGWLGLVAIVWSGWAYTDSSAFPGWIALVPVLGTIAVILAGHGGPATAGWWLARRPATFVGDISYSIYLVHWPLIVLLPFVLQAPLSWVHKLAILLVTVVLAWASKTYVEDPLRTGPLLAARPRRAFVFALAGMVLVAGSTTAAGSVHTSQLEKEQQRAEQVVAEGGECVGPDALRDPAACDGVEGEQSLVPLAVVQSQSGDQRLRSCQTPLSGADVRDCVVGAPGAPVTTALVGDSHGGMWLEAMDALGKKAGVGVRVYVKASCPLTEARRVLPAETSDERQRLCETWRGEVVDRVADDPTITDVVATSFTSAYEWDTVPGGADLDDPATDGFVAVWKRWVEAGKDVHVLRDPPTPTRPVPGCLTTAASPSDCDWPRETVLKPDGQVEAVEAARAEGLSAVSLVDLTNQFCDRRTCFAQIGGIPVYRDASHLSEEYSRLLAPYLAKAVGPGN